MPEEQTIVQTVDLDLDAWLGAPGAESIVTPEQDKNKNNKVKPNIFSRSPADLSFIDDEPTEEKLDKDGNPIVKELEAPKLDDIIKEVEGTTTTDTTNDSPESEEEKLKKAGRPKTDKSGLIEFFKKRIEAKEMFAFDDYDEGKQTLDEYLGTLSEKDLDELYTANITSLKEEITVNTPKEFFESLPKELQYAAKYVGDGGRDLKGLFQALAHVEQSRELDPENDSDQEQIVRNYLQATNFGTDEEISEEITTWKDLGTLSKKATSFKPKLDKMQEQVVAQRLAQQEEVKLQQEQAAKQYVDNVFEALRPGEINGLKLEKNIQAKLYAGLTQPQYPSISGRPTNQLGHLLEKYQFVEPNYSLIAEALWLLSDPEDYRKNIAKSGKNEAAGDIARKLKTEQSNKASSTNTFGDDDDKRQSRKVVRPNANFFKRT